MLSRNFAVLFLFACACHASTIGPAPDQIFATDGVPFHWILEDGRGFVAEDYQGNQIGGINYGATPWLVFDAQFPKSPEPAPSVQCDPVIPPSLPGEPKSTSTPEPGTWISGVLVLLLLAIQIRPRPMYSAAPPVRDPEYRRFIKSLPCLACGTRWKVDPCHTGPHGLGQKSCDLSCIPLCRRHHDEFDAAPVKFAEQHRLDVPALIARFNSFYVEKLRGKAA